MPLSDAEFQKIKDIQAKSVKNYSECQAVLRLIRDCGMLSSGTIATLTGKTKYVEIDEIQADFVRFVETKAPKQNWENWQQAWEEYRKNVLEQK